MKAFGRIALIAAAIQGLFAQASQGKGGSALALAEANKLMSSYESNGKGGKRAHVRTGIAGARRAKVKRAGREQNRRNHS